jgi:hypothetical protein
LVGAVDTAERTLTVLAGGDKEHSPTSPLTWSRPNTATAYRRDLQAWAR